MTLSSFQEKLTGFDRRRPQPEKMLGSIQPGDTFLVTSLDHLARSTNDLFDITQKVEATEASFRSLREPWADTNSSMGKFLLTVFAGLSELERNIINEQTEEGRAYASCSKMGNPSVPSLVTSTSASLQSIALSEQR